MSELARIETVVFLQGVDFFSSCSAEQILRLSGIAAQKRFAAGEEIYAANDAAERLYCVVEGRIRLGDGDAARTVAANGTFGLLDILSGRLRSTRATAETDALVVTVEANDFFDLLANNIEIVKALFRQVLKWQRPGEEGARR